MDWVAESVSKDTYVHIMEQYRPEFTVGKGEKRARSGFTKYEEIDRPVNDTEMQIVQVSRRMGTLKKAHRKLIFTSFYLCIKIKINQPTSTVFFQSHAQSVGLWRFEDNIWIADPFAGD